MIILHDDSDAVVIAAGDILDTVNGGTGTNLSATGPGVVVQASAAADLTVLATPIGSILYGTTGGAPAALAANNTSTRKLLMERAAVADTPVPSWVELAASDIVSGQVALARGGTGTNLGATGPGVLYQATAGANVSTTYSPTLDELVIQAPPSLPDADAIVTMKATAGQSSYLILANSLAGHSWQLIHTLGGGGVQGAFRLYNADTSTNAISVSTTNDVTFIGLTAASGLTASPRNFHTGNSPAMLSTDGTDATPVNTEVYIAEVFVPVNCTITGVANFNGSVASGNIKVGLASSAGAILATSASTAMSGTDTYQRVPFTGTYAAKGPATYYALLFVDNGTARVNCHTVGAFGAAKQTGQVYATGFTAITPASTFTTALGPIASLY